jgi:hypothetical protein
MILYKKNYSQAATCIKNWMRDFPDEDREQLASRLVQFTQTPILVVYSLMLDIGGPNKELEDGLKSRQEWYGDTVE